MKFDIEQYNWSDHATRLKACKAIRKDCATARGIINDALLRYTKKKMNARNKKQAGDMELLFADLADYQSETDIQDSYGYGCVSEKEYDRLIDLWRKREQYVAGNGKFADRVSELVETAMNSIGERYIDFLTETEYAEQVRQNRMIEIERENAVNTYNRRHNHETAEA